MDNLWVTPGELWVTCVTLWTSGSRLGADGDVHEVDDHVDRPHLLASQGVPGPGARLRVRGDRDSEVRTPFDSVQCCTVLVRAHVRVAEW